MLILTSPAKTLDYSSEYQAPFETQPHFLNEASEIMHILKKLSVSDIQKLMDVSKDIAELNFERFKVWEDKHTPLNSRPAIVAYAGHIYQQIHEKEYNEQQAEYMQNSLRIISGLYGLLRPYDLIQPYRLEMNVPLKNALGNNLYSFWGEKLTNYLNFDLISNEKNGIIDLASEEYTHSIDWKKIHVPVVHVVFHQLKKKETVNLGLLAKKARGMMIDFMLKNRIYDLRQLETFAEDGYSFTEKTADTLVFTKTFVRMRTSGVR